MKTVLDLTFLLKRIISFCIDWVFKFLFKNFLKIKKINCLHYIAHGILVPQPGIEPMLPAVEAV